MTKHRILLTGAAGFVGHHLTGILKAGNFDVMATSKDAPAGAAIAELDVTDPAAVHAAVTAIKPTHIVHLAGLPTVAGATANPDEAWHVNVIATLNIARAVLSCAPDCVLIFAGSGEVYGTSLTTHRPVNEATLIAPTNEYAATKAAADLALGAMAVRGLKSIRFRPFNHTGPGQSEDFVIPAFAAQIARIEAGLQPPVIRVGNLDAERDFLDVRDIARAYALAIEKSGAIAAGTIVNLASGAPRRIGDVLDFLLSQSSHRIAIEVDPARARSHDVTVSTADASAAKRLLGWVPQTPLNETLADVLAYWRQRIRR